MKPIIFSGHMVRAILAGRKTQTRRVADVTNDGCHDGFITPQRGYAPRRPKDHITYCPYGQPGDLLWVRERWRPFAWHEGEPIVVEFEDGARKECYNDDPASDYDYVSWEERIWMSVSDELQRKGFDVDENENYGPQAQQALAWRPSIHMPKWACRLYLKITNIRVEQLQNISQQDVFREGLVNGDMKPEHSAQETFAELWNTINRNKPWFSYDKNPWVWVIEFEKVTND